MVAKSPRAAEPEQLDHDSFAQRARELVLEAFRAGLRPPERLTLSDWADRFVILSSKATSQRGAYRTARTPYLREVADALSPWERCREVTVMKGAQLGFTQLAVNWACYTIHQDPSPFLLVEPTEDLLRLVVQQKLDPVIEETPELAALVAPKRSRDGGNTDTTKDFAGGFFIGVWANSSARLRSTTARRLVLDELDAYPPDVGGEGDPSKLAERAMRTFPDHKVLRISTPLVRHASRVEAYYERSSKGRWFMPCPECGAFQVLRFPQLRWETTRIGAHDHVVPESVQYACEACGVLFGEHHKTAMLAAGEWRHEHPELLDVHRGYHLSALASPLGWRSWTEIAQDWEAGKGDQDKRRAVVNLDLAETWEERGEAPEWEDLYARRESWPLGIAPEGVVLVTAGVDVQQDRLELELVGWGEGRESWSIDYRTIPGDTARDSTWEELRRVLEAPVPHAGGALLPVRMAAVDAGYNTSQVLSWTRRQPPDRVIAVMGRNLPKLVGQPTQHDLNHRGKRLRRGAKVWHVGTGVAKSELYGWLRLRPPLTPGDPYPPGFVHFPEHNPQWFRQLTAEHLIARVSKGRRVWHWEVKAGQRNEALDCRVYARAAAEVLGISRWDSARWAAERAAIGGEVRPPRPSRSRRPRSDYWRRY